jgi:hypothetical protein
VDPAELDLEDFYDSEYFYPVSMKEKLFIPNPSFFIKRVPAF